MKTKWIPVDDDSGDEQRDEAEDHLPRRDHRRREPDLARFQQHI